MTTTVADLDAPPDVRPAPRRWSRLLPWTLLAGTVLALATTLAVDPTSEPPPAPAPTEPVVNYDSGGVGSGANFYRDETGVLRSVVVAASSGPGAEAWCRLEVDGQLIEARADGGMPAVCVWSRP